MKRLIKSAGLFLIMVVLTVGAQADGIVGIDINTTETFYPIVYHVFSRTPAKKAGIKVLDIIHSIDGKSTYRMSAEEAVRLIRGEAGASVILTIKRLGQAENLDISITRGPLPDGGLPKDAYSLGQEAFGKSEYEQAKRHFKSLAKRGDPIGQFWVGYLYWPGGGDKSDTDLSVRWMQKSANKGFSTAMRYMGYAYQIGVGVEGDMDKSIQYHLDAAAAGNGAAMFELGSFYNTGLGVAKNQDTAIEWFRKSADVGLSSGELSLGLAYYHGWGSLREDKAEAFKWIKKAADQGHNDAKKMVQKNSNVIEYLQIIVEADKLESEGDMRQALKKYLEAFQKSRPSIKTLKKVIAIAQQMTPPPAIAEDVRRHTVRAQVLLEKASDKFGFGGAAQEYEKAMLAAPWVADSHYNLALVQEQADQFQDAMDSFKLYLLLEPNAQNIDDVQTKIYRLEVEQEGVDQIKELEGTWQNTKTQTIYDAVLEGDQITFTNPSGWVVRGFIEGGSLKGVVTKPGSKTADGACDLPGETTPIIWSRIDVGQKELSLKFMQSTYQYRWKNDSWGNRTCDGVSFQSKSEESIALAHL
jgi:TPR repeat protein